MICRSPAWIPLAASTVTGPTFTVVKSTTSLVATVTLPAASLPKVMFLPSTKPTCGLAWFTVDTWLPFTFTLIDCTAVSAFSIASFERSLRSTVTSLVVVQQFTLVVVLTVNALLPAATLVMSFSAFTV